MNQTKVLEVKKYLYRHLETHLHNKNAAESIALEEQFATQMRKLGKAEDILKKVSTDTESLKEEIKKTIQAINPNAYIEGGISRGYITQNPLRIRISGSTRTFATIGSRETFQCAERFLATAKTAANDIDKFCLGLMLEGGAEDVEQFRTNLLRSI